MVRKSKHQVHDLDTGTDKDVPSAVVRQDKNSKWFIGLDISTTTIGFSLLGKDGKLIELSYFRADKLESLYNKVDGFKLFLEEKLAQHLLPKKDVVVCAENILLAFNRNSSANVLVMLAQMNAMCSYVVHQLGMEIFHLNVLTARKQAGIQKPKNKLTSKPIKEYVREQVFVLYPYVMNNIETYVPTAGKNKGTVQPVKQMEDAIDAFVVAKGGSVVYWAKDK